MGRVLLTAAMILGWRFVIAAMVGGMAAETSEHELSGVIGFVAGAIIASVPFGAELDKLDGS